MDFLTININPMYRGITYISNRLMIMIQHFAFSIHKPF